MSGLLQLDEELLDAFDGFLMEVIPADSQPVARGIAWLRGMQRDDGSWPSQAANGVFFGSAMLDYRLYKTYFPVWALARHAKLSLV